MVPWFIVPNGPVREARFKKSNGVPDGKVPALFPITIWAKTVDDVHGVLKSPANDAAGAVRILNSWGRGYPHRVWMPDATLQRLIDEDGEVALVTDR